MTTTRWPLRLLAASSVGMVLMAHALLFQTVHAQAYAQRPPSDPTDALAFAGGHRGYLTDFESGEDPELILEILSRLGQTVARANDMHNAKRGLDLGVSRGFSGSQAAKHLMGLAAANYAGGPGRRRRSPAA